MDIIQRFTGLLTGEFNSIVIEGKRMTVKRDGKLTVCYNRKKYEIPELKSFNEMWDDVKNYFGL